MCSYILSAIQLLIKHYHQHALFVASTLISINWAWLLLDNLCSIVLADMHMLAHTSMGCPIRIWDIILSHTGMGVRYEYTYMIVYSYVYSQQWAMTGPF